MSDEFPDVYITLRWGDKDGKWRWLAEVDAWSQAGEERERHKAVQAALAAVEARS